MLDKDRAISLAKTLNENVFPKINADAAQRQRIKKALKNNNGEVDSHAK